MRGPPAKAAFDASGTPTKALEGFCRKAGVPVDQVVRELDAKGVEYCWVEVKDAGKPAAEVRQQTSLTTHCICADRSRQAQLCELLRANTVQAPHNGCLPSIDL